MSADSADCKLTEQTHRTATQISHDPLYPTVAHNLLIAREGRAGARQQDSEADNDWLAERSTTAQQGSARPATRIPRPIGAPSQSTGTASQPINDKAIAQVVEILHRSNTNMSVHDAVAAARWGELRGSPLRGGARTLKQTLTKRKPDPPFQGGGEPSRAERGPQQQQQGTRERSTRDLERGRRQALDHHRDDATTAHNAPAVTLHQPKHKADHLRSAPSGPSKNQPLLASPQHAPAGKEQLLMRLANSHHNHLNHHDRPKDRLQAGAGDQQRETSGAESRRRRKKQQQSKSNGRDKTNVYSLSDAQLASRYNFVREIGFGEWGSIWTAMPVKELDHLPSSAYPQITTRKLNGVGHVRVDNPNHRLLAIKVCTRERNSQSSARTERLWHEFKMLRSLVDGAQSSSTDGDATSAGSSSSSSSRTRRGDAVFGSDWHSSIVRFYEFVVTPSIAMIVMPCYDEPMKVGLPDERCRSYFQQLLSGLFWLHQRGACHNDIKVANMLVNYSGLLGKGIPILVDFGFATVHDASKKDAFLTRVSWGTPEYLAPERARGDLHDERASDVWSLGVTFFEIAATRTPFEQQDEEFTTRDQLQAYYHRTMSGVWVGAWDIPPELEDLVRRMLRPTPADRIDAADALLHPYFDPTTASFDNSLEDILDMFPSEGDSVSDSDGGDSTDSGGGAHSTGHGSNVQPQGSKLNHILQRQRLARAPIETDGRGQRGGEQRTERPATPPSPTLSSVGMDSHLTDLVHSTPPWRTCKGQVRARAKTLVRSKLATEQLSDDSGNQAIDAANPDFKEPNQDLALLRIASSLDATQPPSLVFDVPSAASGPSSRHATRTPLRKALANAAIESNLLRLKPAASGRTASPMKRQHDEHPPALPQTPPRYAASREPLHRANASAASPEDIFVPALTSSTITNRVDGLPAGHVSGQTAPTSANSRCSASKPKHGLRTVASLARKFDSSSPDQASGPPKESGAAQNANEKPRRGHGRSKSSSKAVQTEQKSRPSIGVQADAGGKWKIEPSDTSCRSASGHVDAEDKPGDDRALATPASDRTRDSVSIESYLSSDCSPVGEAGVKTASVLIPQPEGHRSISSSFGIVPRPATASAYTVAKLPPFPASESKANGLSDDRRRTSFHRRTKTDVDGKEVRRKLEHMGAIAEALTRMITETRSSLRTSSEEEADRSDPSGKEEEGKDGQQAAPGHDDLLRTIRNLEAQIVGLDLDFCKTHAATAAAGGGSVSPITHEAMLQLSNIDSGEPALLSPNTDAGDACRCSQQQQREGCTIACRQNRARSASDLTVTPEKRGEARSTAVCNEAADGKGHQSKSVGADKLVDPARPPPPSPSKERVEAIYASYLLRNDSCHKVGEGYVNMSPDRFGKRRQQQQHQQHQRARLSLLPAETREGGALDELLDPIRVHRGPSSSSQFERSVRNDSDGSDRATRDLAPQTFASRTETSKPSSGKRFGFGTLRRGRSLASLFSPRSSTAIVSPNSATTPPLVGMTRHLDETRRLPAGAEVIVTPPRTCPGKATKASLGKFSIVPPPSESSNSIVLELEPIVENEETKSISGDGITSCGNSSIATRPPPSINAASRLDGLGYSINATAPASWRRSSSIRRLSHEQARGRGGDGASASVTAAAKKAHRTSVHAGRATTSGKIGSSLWRLLRGGSGSEATSGSMRRRTRKDLNDVSYATLA